MGPRHPHRGLSCPQFLSPHAEVILCADLFTKEVWTFCGLRTAHVLFVLHLGTRRILLAGTTFCPHGRWMGETARNLLMACEDATVSPGSVVHDRDSRSQVQSGVWVSCQAFCCDLDTNLRPGAAVSSLLDAHVWLRDRRGSALVGDLFLKHLGELLQRERAHLDEYHAQAVLGLSLLGQRPAQLLLGDQVVLLHQQVSEQWRTTWPARLQDGRAAQDVKP